MRNSRSERERAMQIVGRLNLTFRSHRLPVIYQTELAECGLACLAMVSCYHGALTDLRAMRRKYSISLKGVTLATLVKISEKMNLASRAIKVEIDDLHLVRTPAVLHWGMNHFVVLKKVRRKTLIIHDPSQGERHVTLGEVSKNFSGIALELTPGNEFKKKEERQKITLEGFFKNVVGLKRSLFQIFILSLVLQILGIVAPYYTQLVIDNVLVGGDKDFLVVLGIGAILLAIVTTIISLMRTWIGIFFNSTYMIQLNSSLVRHMLSVKASWFDSRQIGDILSRFSSLKAVQGVISDGIVFGILRVIVCVATLSVMLVYSPLLTLITLSGLIAYAALRAAFYRPLRQATEESIVKAAEETSSFVETVNSVSSIKIFASESTRHGSWLNKVIATMNANIAIQKLSMLFQVCQVTIGTIESVVMLWVGANMVMASMFTIGMLFAFMAWRGQFVAAVYGLINSYFSYKMLDLHLERVADIALEPGEEYLEADTEFNVKNVQGELTIENLKFRFGTEEEYLFDNLNLNIPAGKSCVVSSPSGCGKTTLIKIMMGLILPEEGSVKLDGVKIEKIGLRNYRGVVGAVMQDDKLISGSLRENITFFSDDPDEELMINCAVQAGIHDEVSKMPMGYDSLVGEMGSMLSGGQAQRVLIARALYRKPKILFLDEATSNLDRALEEKVISNIEKMKITRIHISHRSEIINGAENLIDLEMLKGIKEEK